MAKNTGRSNFGSLARDRNQVAIQTGSSFTNADATGTPQTSPLAYTTGVYTIVVPTAAFELILMPTTDLRVGTEVTVATYDIVKANTKEAIGVANMQTIYIQRDASNGTLYFRFNII